MRRLSIANAVLAVMALVMTAATVPRAVAFAEDIRPKALPSIADNLPPLQESLPGVDVEGPIAVLVYTKNCGACVRAAPHTKEWLEETEIRTLAITRDTQAEGQAFADLHGWDVEVLSTLEWTGRWITPWAYLYDSDGTLVWTGSGHDLNAMDTHIKEMTS